MADKPKFTVCYVTQNEAVEIARCKGRMSDIADIEAFQQHIDECLGGGIRQFCFNLTELSWIGSTGQGMLLTVNTAIKRTQGKLILCGVSPEIKGIFDVTHAGMLFNFADTEAEGLAFLARP